MMLALFSIPLGIPCLQAWGGCQRSCPRISSLELKLQDALKKANLLFDSQYEWEGGFIDIFIKPNLAIFVDGNYWHSFPKAKEKDISQTLNLTNIGYQVIRITETEISQSLDKCVGRINCILDRPALEARLQEFHTRPHLEVPDAG